MTGQEIKAIRKRLDISQTELALKIGRTVDMVRKYEQDVKTPPPKIESLLMELDAFSRKQDRGLA